MGLLDSMVDLVSDVATVAVKPVEIALEVADAAVKPIADGLTEIADEVRGLTK